MRDNFTVDLAVVEKTRDGLLMVCGVPLIKGALCKLMKVASRAGALYRCLSMGQRMYLGLVVKLVDRVASVLVAKVLAPIIVRLLEALKGFPQLMIEVLGRVRYWMIVKGWGKAVEVSRLAQRWGNKTARKWAKEIGFIRYLTILNMSSWESKGNCEACAN